MALNSRGGVAASLLSATLLITLALPVMAYNAACFTEGNYGLSYTNCRDVNQGFSANISSRYGWHVKKIVIKEGYRVNYRRTNYWKEVESQSWGPGTHQARLGYLGGKYRYIRGPFTVVHNDDYDDDSQVCLHKQSSGNGLRFCTDQNVEWIGHSFNDLAQSVTLPPGYTAVLYEHARYGGAKLTVTDDQELSNFAFAKKVSSLQVFEGLSSFDRNQIYYLVPWLDKYRDSRFALDAGHGLAVKVLDENADTQHWKISSYDESGVATFTNGNGVNLCVINPADQNEVFRSDFDNPACRWQVEIVDDNRFRFKNQHHSRYLTMAEDYSVSMSQKTEVKSDWKLRTPSEVLSYAKYRAQIERERISTHPDAPRVPLAKRNASHGTQNDYQTNTFDWQQVNWRYVDYVGSSNPTPQPPIISPYYQYALGRYPFAAPAGSENMLPDMQPESGWELLKHNLGYHMLKDGRVDVPFVQKTYGKPYVMMYNRYTGKLRVIALYNQSPGIYNSATIELSHSADNGGVATNLFAPYSPVPLGRMANTTKATAMVPLIASEDKQWIHAVFNLGYDPCASGFKSVLTLRISPMANGETRLTGRYTGNS